MAWCDAYHALHGRWPGQRSGPIELAPGETWTAVQIALAKGLRGLKGGSSLTSLLAKHRRARNPAAPPKLSLKLILKWADSHRERTGTWPHLNSGDVIDAPGETWLAVSHAMRRGTRGLPPKSSLARLLSEARDVRPKHHRRPPLSVDVILAWADAVQSR